MKFIISAYKAFRDLPVSPQAAKKIPAGLGLFFFCWLAFDYVQVQNNVNSSQFESKALVAEPKFIPPKFELNK